jgi:hypothetical protein
MYMLLTRLLVVLDKLHLRGGTYSSILIKQQTALQEEIIKEKEVKPYFILLIQSKPVIVSVRFLLNVKLNFLLLISPNKFIFQNE